MIVKNVALIPLTVAVFGIFAAPLALAQGASLDNGQSYLAARENLYTPEALSKVVADAQGQRATGQVADTHADLMGAQTADTPEHIDAIFKQVVAQSALVGDNLNPTHDYLADRENMDRLDHINAIIDRSVRKQEQVSQL